MLEEILKQILGQLKENNGRLNNFESQLKENNERLNNFENQLKENNGRLNNFENQLKENNERLSNLEESQGRLYSLEEGQKRIEKRIKAIFEETGGLSEFKTEVINRLGKIDNDIEILAGEMGKQKLEIERLKKRPV